MLLGSDVGLKEAARLAIYGLVGRISYCYLCDIPIQEWVQTHCYPLLGYAPKVINLTSVWLGFICRSLEDKTKLLEQWWIMGGKNLIITKWRVAFNPTIEYFQQHHLWVLLPAFPYTYGMNMRSALQAMLWVHLSLQIKEIYFLQTGNYRACQSI